MASLVPAAQYLRMSTENQQYSLLNQGAAIAEYAESHGFEVVRVYSDEARSGLTLKRRAGLRQLLSDVVDSGRCFSAILVYDVSRWGRFQDIDESAHYEFLCKSAGVPVYYCAEPFESDSRLGNSLLKSLKRSMAAEFSRELGVKVHQGKSQVAAAGFCVGGRTPYGLRRMISSNDQNRCRILENGEQKNLRSERLVLVPGPPCEVACVRRIFRGLLKSQMSPREIARDLNKRGILLRSRRWTKELVERVLTNPVYAGVSIWGRSSQRLGLPRIELPVNQWIKKANSFVPVVTPSEFERAQPLLQVDRGKTYWSMERILRVARELLRRKGNLSYALFERTKGAPSPGVLRQLDFVKICKSVGYEIPQRFLKASKAITTSIRFRRDLIRSFAHAFPSELSAVEGPVLRLVLDNRVPVSVVIGRAAKPVKCEPRWRVIPSTRHSRELTIVACLDATNTTLSELFVFSRIDFRGARWFGPRHPWLNTGTRVEDLSLLCGILRRLMARAHDTLGDYIR